MQQFEFEVDSSRQKQRLDVFLSEAQSEFSRSYLQKLIEDKHVAVNGDTVRANYKLKAGDHVELNVPEPVPMEVAPENIPLKILHEDNWFLVVDKPAGMVVHPAPGHAGGTLVNALLFHCSDLAGIGGVERPGIVHRLDKETSGLVIVAKTDATLHSLASQFKERRIEKEYLALVRGDVKNPKGTINSSIGRHKIHRKRMSADSGREALTEYELIKQFGRFAYLRLYPKTGRTHQIRVHLASIGHPILGDKLYGGKAADSERISRQALHAHKLTLAHPQSGESMIFESHLPEDMASFLK
ncbi:MAG: RluA family pseudouridine synthase [Nitrospinota bacterium]|nr:RluA family pseudouridine synthase [Nitrospinota bacterium]